MAFQLEKDLDEFLRYKIVGKGNFIYNEHVTSFLNTIITSGGSKNHISAKQFSHVSYMRKELSNYMRNSHLYRQYNVAVLQQKKFNNHIQVYEVKFKDNTNPRYKLNTIMKKVAHFVFYV
jgi:spore coat protein CotF